MNLNGSQRGAVQLVGGGAQMLHPILHSGERWGDPKATSQKTASRFIGTAASIHGDAVEEKTTIVEASRERQIRARVGPVVTRGTTMITHLNKEFNGPRGENRLGNSLVGS
ncbi:MAG: hypothetical protein ACE5R6_02770 [Candidatus Heimdallarchaeota archaeon]